MSKTQHTDSAMSSSLSVVSSPITDLTALNHDPPASLEHLMMEHDPHSCIIHHSSHEERFEEVRPPVRAGLGERDLSAGDDDGFTGVGE